MALGADNFDSYATGALAGGNGGTGWGGAWTDGGNDNWQVENTVFQSSPNGVSATSSATDRFIYRVYASSQASGVQGVYMRVSSTTGELDFQINSGGASIGNTSIACLVRFDSSNNIIIFGPGFGSTTTVQTGYNANQFYLVEIDFNGGTGQYRARVDGGVYCAFTGFVNSFSTVDRVVLHNSNNTSGVTQWYDTLYDATPASGIAFDAASAHQTNTGTSFSFNHTCTGSNLMLVVGITSSGGDNVTGVTYNSVALTQASKSTNLSDGNATAYLYYLKGPATGTNSVTITSNSATIQAQSVSYTGALQTGGVDTASPYYNSVGESGNILITVNVSTANSWLATAFDSTDANPTAVVNGINRATLTAGVVSDSYSAVGSGNQTIGYTWGVSDRHAIVALAFAPTSTAVSGRDGRALNLLGVGQ